jgi:glutaredoxin
MKLVLVTRQGCHLCEEALVTLRTLGAEPELADVDADPALFDRYDWRVPVLLRDGRVVAEGKITRGQLIQALNAP